MSSFTLTNIATDIDSAITRVVGADTSPTNASQNMVTSGGVKAAIDAIGSGSSAIITVDSFTDASLEDSSEGLTDTDTAVPTSAAVVDYVDNYGRATMGSLTSITAGTRTAASDLFITVTSAIVKGQSHQGSSKAVAKITINNVEFVIYPPTLVNNNSILTTSSSFFVKKGETYVLDLPNARSGTRERDATAHYRTFNFTL